MKISVQSFGGIAPLVPPRYLKDNQAQTATNCDTRGFSLKPLSGLGSSLLTLTKSGTIETIYRFGQDISAANRPTQYWFHWDEDVDVCRGQVSGDTSEFTYFTGETFAPQMTWNTPALTGGTDYPEVSYNLGFPAPTNAPTVSSDDTTLDPESGDVNAVYVYTWVWTVGSYTMEGPPSAASAQAIVSTSSTVTINNFASVPAGYTVTHKRIYRSEGGSYFAVPVSWSGGSGYDVPAATTSVTDTNNPDELAEEIPSLYNFPPPATMRGLVNLPNGIMAGFVGRDVYFCEPYKPYAWPTQYMQSLDFPVVGLGVIDTTLVVLTTGTPYFIQGSHPDSMTVVQTDMEQACVSKRSIVSMDGKVVYASPDGIVALSPGGSKILTLESMDRATWQGYGPSTTHAYGHDRRYVAFTTSAGFVYDFDTQQFTRLGDMSVTAGYNDLQDDALYLVNGSKQVVKWGAGSALSYVWKSKKFTLPRVLSFASAQVYAETYANLSLKIYGDGNLLLTKTVTSRAPFRLPPTPAFDWEFQVEGTDEVFAVNLAQSAEELAEI